MGYIELQRIKLKKYDILVSGIENGQIVHTLVKNLSADKLAVEISTLITRIRDLVNVVIIPQSIDTPLYEVIGAK